MKLWLSILVGFTALIAALVIGCGGETESSDYPQVDRAGRPGLLELMVSTNSYMNQWNGDTPQTDLSAVADPIRAEMSTFLGYITTYSNAHGMTPLTEAKFLYGFLPDVIRIDTDLPNSGYNIEVVTSVDGAPLLTGGRMIADDAMDVFLSMIFDSDSTGTSMQDHVTYAGPGVGVNPAQPGKHAMLASFPYLASPN